MKTFQHFLREQDEQQAKQQQAKELESKVKELSQPQNVQRAIQSLGVQNVDELIQKLERNPQVKQVIAKYNQLKQQGVSESVLDEGIFGDIVGGIAKALWGVVKWAIGSVAKTILHVLGGFGAEGAPPMSKLNYAGMLLLTFGLSGTLLATGAPMAVVAASVPMTATWWGLMWFGKNFLEPMLRAAEGVPQQKGWMPDMA